MWNCADRPVWVVTWIHHYSLVQIPNILLNDWLLINVCSVTRRPSNAWLPRGQTYLHVFSCDLSWSRPAVGIGKISDLSNTSEKHTAELARRYLETRVLNLAAETDGQTIWKHNTSIIKRLKSINVSSSEKKLLALIHCFGQFLSLSDLFLIRKSSSLALPMILWTSSFCFCSYKRL